MEKKKHEMSEDLAFLERTLQLKRAEVRELQKRIRNEKRRMSRSSSSSSLNGHGQEEDPGKKRKTLPTVGGRGGASVVAATALPDLYEDRLLARLTNACGVSGIPTEELLRVLLPESVTIPSADRAGPLYHAYLRPIMRKHYARVLMRNNRVFWRTPPPPKQPSSSEHDT